MGYHVYPVEAVGSRYECQICLLILRDPVQLSECGHRFCKLCMDDLVKRSPFNVRCPIDRGICDVRKLFDDKGYNREVLDIHVRCKNYASGCPWTGEIRELQDHVANHCMTEMTPCPNDKCKMRIYRTSLNYHKNELCLYRELSCFHCNDKFIYIKKKDHLNSCRRFPSKCKNGCGADQVPRNEMQEHLSECPLAIVTCGFENIGCTIKFQRKLKKAHLEDYNQTHLQLAVMKINNLEKTCQEQGKEMKTLKSENEVLKDQIKRLEGYHYQHEGNSFVMIIENYNRKLEEEKTNGGKLFSDPHIIQSFKMRLEVYLNGHKGGTGTHLSVYWQLMKGELDDCLEWPFDKAISFVLIHQDDNNKFFKMSISNDFKDNADSSQCFQKPVTDCNVGFGYTSFISHEKLRTDGFIKNDRLYLCCIIT